jgi:hypothetical protein
VGLDSPGDVHLSTRTKARGHAQSDLVHVPSLSGHDRKLFDRPWTNFRS